MAETAKVPVFLILCFLSLFRLTITTAITVPCLVWWIVCSIKNLWEILMTNVQSAIYCYFLPS